MYLFVFIFSRNRQKIAKLRVVSNISLIIPNLVPQRPFCYLNFINVAKP